MQQNSNDDQPMQTAKKAKLNNGDAKTNDNDDKNKIKSDKDNDNKNDNNNNNNNNAVSISATASISTRNSYPMPSPVRRQSSIPVQFNPIQYDLKNDDDDDDDNDDDIIDLQASIASLPPLKHPISVRKTNEMEIYGWGCIDPLLYQTKQITTNKDGDNDVNMNDKTDKKNDDNVGDDDDDDEIISPSCLVVEDSLSFNFNDMCGNYNCASFYQRDCTGLYGWGDNDDGGIGNGISNQIKSPSVYNKFKDKPIRFISIGEKHTAAILQYGGLYVFGSNENGQCGLISDYLRVKPDLVVPRLESAKMCQVACGSSMTIALTRHGTLYSFGNKDIEGLLGRTNYIRWPNYEPNVVSYLYYNPVIEISCGERHCIVRTAYKRIFGWGKNNHGQLGLGDTNSRKIPNEIKVLSSKDIIQIECGGSHSCVLTSNGVIYCFGNNNYSQCAADSSTKQVVKPTEVEGKWPDNSITQISCGRYHTLCTDSQKLWGFGQNLQGQCTGYISDGTRISKPTLIKLNYNNNNTRIITRICGTNFSSLILTKTIKNDCNNMSSSNIQILRRLKPIDYPSTIGFNQLNILCAKIESQKTDITYLQSLLTTVFGSPSCLNQAFMTNINIYKTRKGSGIHFKQMNKIYHRILNLSPTLTNRLNKSMLTLARRSGRYIEFAHEASNLRFYFLILLFPDITNPGFNHDIMKQLNELIRRIQRNKPAIFKELSLWISTWSLQDRLYILDRLQECMSTYIDIKQKIDHYAAFICDPIKMIYESNKLISDINLRISYNKFYNRSLTRNNLLDFKSDYVQWGSSNINSFSFCDYPFLLDPVAKRNILKIEKGISKLKHAQQPLLFNNNRLGGMGLGRPFMGFIQPYFIIRVRRKSVLQDTLNIIIAVSQHGGNEFYKELKVIFDNEEGVDQGGVRKEFFQLIIREFFDIKYGTFVYNSDTRCYWFNKNALEQPQEYMLLGIILGLAIYNGVLLDLHFPGVVYKKLCNQYMSVNDLKDFDPQIYKSTQQIINYKGNIEDLCLTFSIDYMKWDKLETYDLIKNGRNIAVTNDNKNKYINLLTNYYLTDSISTQFDAFNRGFKLVLKGKAFDMFSIGKELELVICGTQQLDFDALEVSCKYEGGYNENNKYIRWLWDILHEFDDEQKRLFLKFFSGSDRAPLRGLGKLGMLVQKATGNDYNGHQLPTAHTCFNALLLPAYQTKQIMKNKLLCAIKYSEGFGLK